MPDINKLFEFITDTYLKPKGNSVVGRTQLSRLETNTSWILTDIQLSNNSRVDIIQFYNIEFLPKMRDYILTTKNMVLQQGAKTPVLGQSNYDALLTVGGTLIKKNHVHQLYPMTPLIDQIEINNRNTTVVF